MKKVKNSDKCGGRGSLYVNKGLACDRFFYQMHNLFGVLKLFMRRPLVINS